MKVRARAPFPIGKPNWPASIPRPPAERHTGVHYDTDWARTYGARIARAFLLDDVVRPLVRVIASPEVHGEDRLVGLEAPAIFVANHHSHLDTGLLLTSLPARFRHRTAVAAAADYFFPSRARGALSALVIGAIPMERTKVGRRSADLAAELLDDGWNLLMFPEGGRSPDGWGRAFRGGAAYLSLRCNRPVVPLYLEGTGRLWRRGSKLPKVAGRGEGVHVVMGAPMWAEEGEDARRLAARIEATVATLADEWSTGWWSARRRAAKGDTPALTGPTGGAWRRAWALDADASRRDGRRAWP
ncbi:MAG TPA: lysophospholipid acyltransferase family protein [Acidimicrobiales bacterium]|nr:lysophospholipid acyltransferase family protein [Acidimicrobiales bacterium]